MIDSKAKRGSAQGIGLPFRVWICEPVGTSSRATRLSFLRYYFPGEEAADVVELFGPIRSVPALRGALISESLGDRLNSVDGLRGIVQ